MNTKQVTTDLIKFYIEAEKLKTTMRHSLTSNTDRVESTAEHSWMICLIAMTIFEYIEVEIDQLKVMKMLVLHDLAEAVIGDIPAHDTQGRIGKYEREKSALIELMKPLSQKAQTEFLSLWEECEEKETYEAKIAQAIDKFEAPLQHNIFGVDKWDQNDFDLHAGYKMEFHLFDPFIKELRDELEIMSRKKITEAKQLHRLPEKMQKVYKVLNDKDEK